MKSDPYRRAAACACLAIAWLFPRADAWAGVESLRVLSTQGAVFDYLFASGVTHAGEAPVLAFNHRNGRTFFLKVGDTLAGYRLASFEPRRRARFHAALNATLDEDASVVTLTKPDGTALRLDRGVWLPQPGRMATLVSLDTAASWKVQEGDAVVAAADRFRVSRIDEEWLLLEASAGAYAIPLISEDERENLPVISQEVQRIAAEQRQEARRLAREESERQVLAEREEREIERERQRRWEAARAEAAARSPKLSISVTDYFLPPACRTFPFVYALPGGRIRISYLVVPSGRTPGFHLRPLAWP